VAIYPMKFEITYVGNVDDNRVDAEVSYKRWYSRIWRIAAIVYKSADRYEIEYFGKGQNLPGISDTVEEAIKGLEKYVNSEGIKIGQGITRAAHSLELMLNKNGTAMGVKLAKE
jgi:hypothetical protein